MCRNCAQAERRGHRESTRPQGESHLNRVMLCRHFNSTESSFRSRGKLFLDRNAGYQQFVHMPSQLTLIFYPCVPDPRCELICDLSLKDTAATALKDLCNSSVVANSHNFAWGCAWDCTTRQVCAKLKLSDHYSALIHVLLRHDFRLEGSASDAKTSEQVFWFAHGGASVPDQRLVQEIDRRLVEQAAQHAP